MAQLKKLSDLLINLNPSQDNLHLIAISNLADFERQVIRYWCKKYKVPRKPLGDHTIEELYIEMLEDYYERKPGEAERFKESIRLQEVGDWDGKMSLEYEKEMQDYWKKKNPVNIEKYQSEEDFDEEDEKHLMENLGMSLPKSKMSRSGSKKIALLGDEEFEDAF